MKKQILILVTLIALIGTSCKKEESLLPLQAKAIVTLTSSTPVTYTFDASLSTGNKITKYVWQYRIGSIIFTKESNEPVIAINTLTYVDAITLTVFDTVGNQSTFTFPDELIKIIQAPKNVNNLPCLFYEVENLGDATAYIGYENCDGSFTAVELEAGKKIELQALKTTIEYSTGANIQVTEKQ